MKIIRKEMLEFNEREIEAMRLVLKICSEVDRETNDPDLQILAKRIYNDLTELWG